MFTATVHVPKYQASICKRVLRHQQHTQDGRHGAIRLQQLNECSSWFEKKRKNIQEPRGKAYLKQESKATQQSSLKTGGVMDDDLEAGLDTLPPEIWAAVCKHLNVVDIVVSTTTPRSLSTAQPSN